MPSGSTIYYLWTAKSLPSLQIHVAVFPKSLCHASNNDNKMHNIISTVLNASPAPKKLVILCSALIPDASDVLPR